jgi:ribosomal protein S18 acetylase RimI-like enzyme
MTAMQPSLRVLEPGDWGLFRDLRLRALADSPDAFGPTLGEESSRAESDWRDLVAALTTTPSRVLFAAEHGSRSVGLAYGRLEEGRPEVAHLGAMWVDPAARRLGTGRALVAAVIAWARARGVRCVELQVTEANALAERLYASAGFVATGEARELRAGSPLRVRTLRLALSPERV